MNRFITDLEDDYEKLMTPVRYDKKFTSLDIESTFKKINPDLDECEKYIEDERQKTLFKAGS